MAAERFNLPAAVLRLVVNYIVIYDFCGSAADVVNPSNPFHLIVCFEFFCYAFTLCNLFYDPHTGKTVRLDIHTLNNKKCKRTATANY